MIFSSTKFTFGPISTNSFVDENNQPFIINATLSRDMYEQVVGGNRKISTESIAGRDEVYFKGIDTEPVRLQLTIAFQKHVTTAVIRQVLRWLLGPKTYVPITFDEGQNYLFAIFTGSNSFYYVGKEDGSTIGYLKMFLETNSPYLYSGNTTVNFYQTEANSVDGTGYTITNFDSDEMVYPDITISNLSTTDPLSITISNAANGGGSFQYANLAPQGVLEFRGFYKQLSLTGSNENPYSSWYRDYLVLRPKEINGDDPNVITFTTGASGSPHPAYRVSMSYRNKRYI
jgi:hypothetical protein